MDKETAAKKAYRLLKSGKSVVILYHILDNDYSVLEDEPSLVEKYTLLMRFTPFMDEHAIHTEMARSKMDAIKNLLDRII